ncbi:MAG: hypothetical protein IIB58_00185 [Planctomycetes bacterium]|nr:hypothetical protein [Planctomycetota bacterium]
MNYNNSHHFGHCQTATMQDGCSLSDLVGFSRMEVWKEVKGFPNYSVSSLGRVYTRNIRKGYVKKQMSHKGYHRINLYKNHKQHPRREADEAHRPEVDRARPRPVHPQKDHGLQDQRQKRKGEEPAAEACIPFRSNVVINRDSVHAPTPSFVIRGSC